MARNASVVEINGNRYDAVSGQVIGAVKKVAAQVKNPASGVIDGLTRRPSASIKSTAKRASNYSKAVNARRQVQHSQTLMRSVVSRPSAIDKKPANATKLHRTHSATPSPARLSHAKSVTKSPRVERFGKLRLAPTARSSKSSDQLAPNRTIAKAAQSVSTQPLPSMVASASHQHLERLLDHALTHASAHKQVHKPQATGWKRITSLPKWPSLVVILLVLLLAAGFLAWQNIPQLSMRVASMRAHVGASVPAYTPMGYSYAAPISTAKDKVTINYQSSTPQNTFAITQQASNWDSSSVATNAVPANSQVQTSQVNGTTVYIYGAGNDAKWVNHGVLFTLSDKANLSSDQILKIANGL